MKKKQMLNMVYICISTYIYPLKVPSFVGNQNQTPPFFDKTGKSTPHSGEHWKGGTYELSVPRP